VQVARSRKEGKGLDWETISIMLEKGGERENAVLFSDTDSDWGKKIDMIAPYS